MRDIAKEAGVSVVTVSRALNDKPDIEKNTKKRILDIARRLNYFPNILAQNLRTRKTKTIGVIIPDIGDPFYVEILHGVGIAIRKYSYQIILSVLSQRRGDVEEELEALQMLIGKRVDGILLQPETEDSCLISALDECPIPFVLWNRCPKGLDCNFVTNDHEYGSFLAANHLFEKGHSDIYYLIRSPKIKCVLERIRGCQRAARVNGLLKNAIHVIECDDNVRNAYEKTTDLLKNGKSISAIYT